MMEVMPGREYYRWAAYFKLKPPGDRLVASMIYNVNRKTDSPFIMPTEFLTALNEAEKPQQNGKPIRRALQTGHEISAILNAAAPKEEAKRGRRKKK